MPTPQKLADALARVRQIADKNRANIVQSAEIGRQDRELLTRTNWLQEIIKGWYMLTRPDLAAGDSAAWYANFWDFLRVYLENRYGKNYCLSAEASLELQIGKSLMPKQVIVIVPQGGIIQHLPFETSIMTYPDTKSIPDERIEINGLQVMPLALALCKVAPNYFRNNSEDAEIALRSIRSAAEISRVILQYGFQRAAERLIGAYQFIGMKQYADEIENILSGAGLKIVAKNPFSQSTPALLLASFRSPYAARIEMMWQQYRDGIIKIFPKAPGLPQNPKQYLAQVEELYEYDAYNSLSIEGYQVTIALIEKVRNNAWSPDTDSDDAKQSNALAARGYYEAFQVVKKTLTHIVNNQAAGQCVHKDLGTWYQNLFAPSVRANILAASDVVGYRNDRVYIRNSRHAPPPKEAVIDAMEALFKCLEEETVAAVRAILGHYIFVYIHPYMDGNGRIARFLLNTMLASGGYPWTVVEVKRRKQYITALETAHTKNNLELFTQFILEEMRQSERYLKDNINPT